MMFRRFIAAVLVLMIMMMPVASVEELQSELAEEDLISIEEEDVVSSELEAPVEEAAFELGEDDSVLSEEDIVSEESNEFEVGIVSN